MGMNVGSSSGGEPDVIMDVNTTPLIDVMLVLLVMLIITIPIQLHTVNLDMPPPSSNPPVNDPIVHVVICLLYTSPSPRDRQKSRMPSSA